MPDIIQRLKDAYSENPAKALDLLPELFQAADEGKFIVTPVKCFGPFSFTLQDVAEQNRADAIEKAKNERKTWSRYHKFYDSLLPYAGNFAYGTRRKLVDRISYHMALILPLPKE